MGTRIELLNDTCRFA